MKGLLLKEGYNIKRRGFTWILICVAFLVGTFTPSETFNIYFSLYAAIWASMVAFAGLQEDEKSRWQVYCDALPYSRGQVVSSKYLVIIINVLLLALIQMIGNLITGYSERIPMNLLLMMTVGLLCPCLIFPFTFWLGASKGLFAYYVVIVTAAVGMGILGSIVRNDIPELLADMDNSLMQAWDPTLIATTFACVIVLFAGSWFLSIRLYRRREL
ncbi:MAG: ABC-2 transporter permease [Acetatifactor sp.]|nr:ABC-2 transporter permease [Acetatifactor sp.]